MEKNSGIERVIIKLGRIALDIIVEIGKILGREGTRIAKTTPINKEPKKPIEEKEKIEIKGLLYGKERRLIYEVIGDISRTKKIDKLFRIYNKTKKARIRKKLDKRMFKLIEEVQK